MNDLNKAIGYAVKEGYLDESEAMNMTEEQKQEYIDRGDSREADEDHPDFEAMMDKVEREHDANREDGVTDLAVKTTRPIELVDKFVALKKKRAEIKQLKEILDAQYNAVRDSLVIAMTDLDVLSLKTGKYIISRKSLDTVSIDNERLVIQQLKDQGIEPTVKLDRIWARSFLKEYVGVLGNEVKGVSLGKTAYVTVKLNEKKGI